MIGKNPWGRPPKTLRTDLWEIPAPLTVNMATFLQSYAYQPVLKKVKQEVKEEVMTDPKTPVEKLWSFLEGRNKIYVKDDLRRVITYGVKTMNMDEACIEEFLTDHADFSYYDPIEEIKMHILEFLNMNEKGKLSEIVKYVSEQMPYLTAILMFSVNQYVKIALGLLTVEKKIIL